MLARDDVTDIYVNRPGEIWVETLGGATERHDAPALDRATLDRLSRQIAALSHQGISREHPLLSATLPDGARVQVVAPPATRGELALAIRKHVSSDLGLSDYVASGSFAETRRAAVGERSPVDIELARLLDAGDVAGMLANAVVARKNILVSGGTSTGKTTFLNALIREIPAHERLILIEDLVLDHRLHRVLTGRGYKWVRRTGLNSWYVPADAPMDVSLEGRVQFVRKYYLGVPFRHLREALRRARRRLGWRVDPVKTA